MSNEYKPATLTDDDLDQVRGAGQQGASTPQANPKGPDKGNDPAFFDEADALFGKLHPKSKAQSGEGGV
jgi:hypothetical protein